MAWLPQADPGVSTKVSFEAREDFGGMQMTIPFSVETMTTADGLTKGYMKGMVVCLYDNKIPSRWKR